MEPVNEKPEKSEKPVDPVKEKRARLLAAKAAREAEAAAKVEAIELAVLELEDRLATEVGGARGVDWDIVGHGEILIGIRRGPSLAFKGFQGSKQTEADIIGLVKTCAVSPDPSEVGSILEEYPALAVRTALAIAGLFGAKLREDAGK